MSTEREYTIAETAEKVGVSVSTLGILMRSGLIPPPAKRGRTHTYSEAIVEQIPSILEQRRIGGQRARRVSMQARWNSPEREQLAFGISAAWGAPGSEHRKQRIATVRAAHSPEFMAHQGRLKNPDNVQRIKAAQQEFLNDPSRYQAWIESLTVAANNPEVQRRKSESMKVRMAAKRAEVERLRKALGGRPGRRKAIFAKAKELHDAGISWSQCALRLLPEECKKHGPKKIGKRLQSGVLGRG